MEELRTPAGGVRAGDGTEPVLTGDARRDPRRPVLLVVTALFTASLVSPAVVVGTVIVTPRFVSVVLGLCLVVAVVRHHWRRHPRFTVWVGLRVACLSGAVLLVVLVSFLLRSMDSYLLLEPSGPDGCRVVAKETSFLFAGSGEAGTVGRFGGVVLWQSSWTADDGIMPLANGQYTLTWDGNGASLYLMGDGADPVWPGNHGLTC